MNRQAMFAVARYQADLTLAALQRTDQRASDAFFIEGFGIFAPGAHLYYRLALPRDVVGARQGSDSLADRRTGF